MTVQINTFARAASVLAALTSAGAAAAQATAQTPSISGNSWVAIGILVAVAALILLFVSGVLRMSKIDDTTDEEDAGIGVLEGIEEDDQKP